MNSNSIQPEGEKQYLSTASPEKKLAPAAVSKSSAAARAQFEMRMQVRSSEENSQIIINRLYLLIGAADKAGSLKGKKVEQTANALKPLLPVLNQALALDTDMALRLSEVAIEELQRPSQQCRQLHEMRLYFTLLNHHLEHAEEDSPLKAISSEQRAQLNAFIQELGKTVVLFTEATAPPWRSHLDKLEALIREQAGTEELAALPQGCLEQESGIPIDKKTFAAINLETMILGSVFLEGNFTQPVVSYLEQFLNKNQARYQSMPGFGALQKMVRDEKALFEAGFGLDSDKFKEMARTYQQFLSQKVQELSSGAKTMLPIGWTCIPAGHAMQMVVERQPNGLLRVCVYNTGAGLEHHPVLVDKGEELYQPFIAFTDVNEAQLCHEQFVQALVELQLFTEGPGMPAPPGSALERLQQVFGVHGASTSYDQEDLYGLFSNGLRGQLAPCEDDRSKFIPSQYSGTCTWSVLAAVMQTSLSAKDFSTMLCDLSLDSIRAFYPAAQGLIEQLREINADSTLNFLDKFSLRKCANDLEETLLMLQHAAIHAAQTAAAAYNIKGISAAELKEVYAALKELQEFLEKAEGQFEFDEISDKQGSFEGIQAADQECGTIQISLEFEVGSAPPVSSVSAAALAGSISSEISFDWLLPNRMGEGLQSLQAALMAKINAGAHMEAATLLETFFCLQAAEGSDAIWNAIPADKLSAATVGLANLGETLFSLCEKLPNNVPQYSAYSQYLWVRGLLLSARNQEHNLSEYALSSCQKRGECLVYLQKEREWTVASSDTYTLYSPFDRALREKICILMEQYESLIGTLDMGSEGLSKAWAPPLLEFHTGLGVTTDIPISRSLWNERMELCSLLELRYLLSLMQAGYPLFGSRLLQLMKFSEDDTIKQLAMQDHFVQAVLALCDWYGAVLPPAFCALQRLRLIASTLERQQVHPLKAGKAFHSLVHADPNSGDLIFKFSDAPRELTTCNVYSEFSEPKNPKPFLELISVLNELMKGSPHFSTESDLMSGHAHDEWERQLKLMMVKGDYNQEERYLEQQVVKAVAYFSRHLPSLEEHDRRMILRLLLFHGNYLEKLLAKSPAMQRILADFIQKGCTYFAERGKAAGAAFFLELARNLQALPAFIPHVSLQEPAFKDFKSYCAQQLAQREWSGQERTLLYQQIAASYADFPPEQFTAEDAVRLLTAGIHQELYPLLETYQESAYLQYQVAAAFSKLSGRMQVWLQGESGSQICNAVLRCLEPNAKEALWDCKSCYPRCVSNDGRTLLDVQKCTLYREEKSLSTLPRSVLKHFEFTRIFTKKDYLVQQIGPDSFEFVDEQGIKTHIQQPQGIGLLIKQELEGRWYQLTAGNFTNKNLLPADFEDLVVNSSHWVAVDHKDEVVLRNQQRMITHRIPCKINLYKNPDKNLDQITLGIPLKVRSKGEPLALQLIKPALKEKRATPFAYLFEKGMLWKDAAGDFRECEIPSLGLSFTMSRHEARYWRADSTEYPGYFLAPNQRYRGLGVIVGALVLENEQGKRKLVLPYGKIKSGYGSFTKKVWVDLSFKTQPFSLAVDLDAASKPLAKSKEQQLYIAGLLLAQKQYEQAQALLRASFSHTLPYKTSELQLVEQAAGLAMTNHDNSPQAGAVCCTALALLDQASVEWSDKSQQDLLQKLKSFGEAYLHYKRQAQDVAHLKLTLDEERQALHFLLENMKQTKGLSEQALALLFYHAQLAREPGKEPDPYAAYPGQSLREKGITITVEELHKAIYQPQPETPPLLTRPGRWLMHKFLELYENAIRNPSAISIQLAAAAHDRDLPADIVTVLRWAMTARESAPDDPFIPPKLEAIQTIVKSKDAAQFSALLEQARLWEWRQIEQSNKSFPPIVLKGEARPAASSEGQQIQLRKTAEPALQAQPVPERSRMLKEPAPLPSTTAQMAPLVTTASDAPAPAEQVFQEIPSRALHLDAAEIAELQQAIAGGVLNSATPEAQQRAQQIAHYWQKSQPAEPWHRLRPEKLASTKTLLLVEQSEMGKRLRRMERELLDYANALPADEAQRLLFAAEKMALQRQPITLRDLVLFAARASHFTLAGKNPALAAQESALLSRCLVYLDAAAQQQQLKRALKALSDLEAADAVEYDRFSEKMYQELTRAPPYKAHAHPELLAFEVLEEKGLHAWQYTDLMRMLKPKPGENSNLILEKAPGSGKSKVYLSLLALSKADGEHIPFIVVHASQYEAIADAMEIQAGQHFAQVAHALEFSRASSTSVEALEKIYQGLQRVQRERHFFVVTDKSLHSLTLAFDELWDQYLDTGNEKLEPRIEMLRKILNLIKTKGKATLDEADLLLNCRYETVYAMGEAQPIKEAHRNLVADLYESLAAHLEELQPFTESAYLAKKGQLIDAYVSQVIALKMPSLDLEKVKAYLRGQQPEPELPEDKRQARQAELARAFKEGAAYVDGLPAEQRNLLAIPFYQFEELFPIVLEKRCGEHYGYSHNPGKVLPVPYLASGVPNPTAEYSFPYVLLDYAVQTLMQEGVSPLLLKRLIEKLQSRAVLEQREDPDLPLEKTLAYMEFQELCGGVSIPFLGTKAKDIAKLAESYRQKPPNLYQFAKKYLFPAATLHPRKLTSTPYTLDGLFLETQGFTGTPWNARTYPGRLQLVRDPNSAGKTEGIIWKNSQAVQTLSSSDFQDNIAEICQADGVRAFIDVGAIFNGIENKDAAQAFLEKLPKEVKGVLFFKGDRPYVLDRAEKEKPFQDYQDTKELFLFYDQWHTTGMDFIIPGKSLLSFGKNSKMRDLEQGYMRDRQAAEGARVSFVLSPEANKFVRAQLKLKPEQQITTAHILRCAEINQESELEEQLVMASLGKFRETLDRYLKRLQRDSAIPPKTLLAYAGILRPLLGDTAQDAPYEQLGRWREQCETGKIFAQIADAAAKKLEPLLSHPHLSKLAGIQGLTVDSLKQQLLQCVDLELLPKTMAMASSQRPDQLAEQQAQQLSQQQRLALARKDQQTEPPRTATEKGPLRWNFLQPEAVGTRAFYRTLKPADLQPEELPVRKLGSTKVSKAIEEEKTTSKTVLSNAAQALKNFQSLAHEWELPSGTLNSTQAPFLALSEVLAADSKLQAYADVFEIEASYNILPVKAHQYVPIDLWSSKSQTGVAEIDFPPLNERQLDARCVLICKDRQNGAVQVRLLSQADMGFFFEHLKPQAERELDVTLCHLDLKVLQSNSPAILAGQEKVLEGEAFEKFVQAKFFSGEILYSKAERDYLRRWIKAKGPKRMEALFVQEILSCRKEKKSDYVGSTLHAIFSELIPEW
jgi:hypothetical protein